MSEAKWYVLHTYSGYEKNVSSNIMKLVENKNLHHLIEEVLVPTEKVVEEHDGKTKEYESILFPGYVYVKMVLTDESWYICRYTRGVTGFVGPGSKPIPLTDEEVMNLGIGAETVRSSASGGVDFVVGDTVKILSGNLTGFEGTVDSIDEENGKVTVIVSMFGRPTSALLDISAVQKVQM